MNAQWLLAIYCLAILLASLAGGWVTMLIRLTHRRLELALSFVSGVMLGISLLHMLPHAVAQYLDTDHAGHGHASLEPMWWMIGGFLGIFLLERFFPFHVHEPVAAADHEHDHSHGHAHDHAGHECADKPIASSAARRLSWPAALLGFTVHSIIGGMALAATVELEAANTVSAAGLGVFLVIVLHKPFDSIAVGTLMAADNTPHLSRHVVNSFFGLMVPLGVVLFALGLSKLDIAHGRLVGATLALSSGVFLCIALSDVLPELQFHRHDRIKLSVALVLGIALAGVIAHYEAKAHSHQHSGETAVQPHDHDYDGHDHDHDH